MVLWQFTRFPKLSKNLHSWVVVVLTVKILLIIYYWQINAHRPGSCLSQLLKFKTIANILQFLISEIISISELKPKNMKSSDSLFLFISKLNTCVYIHLYFVLSAASTTMQVSCVSTHHLLRTECVCVTNQQLSILWNTTFLWKRKYSIDQFPNRPSRLNLPAFVRKKARALSESSQIECAERNWNFKKQ